MVPKLKDHVRIQKSIEVAKEIQQNLLPESIPALPGFEIDARCIYCDETGGDYFDFLFAGTTHERFAVAVGDVSGHGIAAALLMASARAYIRGIYDTSPSLSDHMTAANRLITEDVRLTGRFMTLFLLEVDRESRTFRWVRAGHDPAIVIDPETKTLDVLGGPGMVSGVDEAYVYQQQERRDVAPGTLVLVATDGLWEANDIDGKMFGKDRLNEILMANRHRPVHKIADAVLNELKKYCGDLAREDDVTFVIIRML